MSGSEMRLDIRQADRIVQPFRWTPGNADAFDFAAASRNRVDEYCWYVVKDTPTQWSTATRRT